MPDEIKMEVSGCSVKVMRSYDYCHFEVCLSGTKLDDSLTSAEVDELRKQAARLADKAVAQYKVAKLNAEKILEDAHTRSYLVAEIDRIRNIKPGDRTVNEAAKLKAFDDEFYEARRQYDYEDQWNED